MLKKTPFFRFTVVPELQRIKISAILQISLTWVLFAWLHVADVFTVQHVIKWNV